MRITLLLSTILAICTSISQALPDAQGWEFLLFYTAWQTELASGVTPRVFAAQPHGILTNFHQFMLQIVDRDDLLDLKRFLETSDSFNTTAPEANRIASEFAQATRTLENGSSKSLQVRTDLERLFVHAPTGRDDWADSLQNSITALRLAFKHAPRLQGAARSCARFFKNIHDIRYCNHSNFQIKRLRNTQYRPKPLGKPVNVELKQGPLPGNNCKMIDYAATWQHNSQLTNSDKEAIVSYMRPEAQGRDAREHLRVISVTASGVLVLNEIIKDCSRKQAGCSVM